MSSPTEVANVLTRDLGALAPAIRYADKIARAQGSMSSLYADAAALLRTRLAPWLVSEVRRHAQAHYNEGGWDYIVEAYTDEELLAAMDGALDLPAALHNVAREVAVLSSRRSDIQGL